MMGYENEEVKRLFRLYMVLHADHEGVMFLPILLTWWDCAEQSYYAYAAGMTGLAGPLHVC